MKLTIQHLATYLPYGLQVKYNDCTYKKTHIATLSGVSNDGIETTYKRRFKGCSGDYITFKGRNNIVVLGVKPILRHLSDLTKEIEHNGERFVPIERLFEIENPQHAANGRGYYYEVVPNWVSCSTNYTAVAFTVYLNSIKKNQYWVIEQLIQWHFDCFSLLENNLAIDINTIQK